MASKPQNETSKIDLKNLKNPDDFHQDKFEVISGKMPDNIKERCLQLCNDYIGGDWLRQTVDTVVFKRLSGGWSSQLYYMAMKQPSANCGVSEQVLRFYGQKPYKSNDRLTEVVIALVMSENNLGPKVYGVFDDGMILHFYKVRVKTVSSCK